MCLPDPQIDHLSGEYVRGVTGTFHHVSEQYLDRYVAEFEFWYNNREVSDGEPAIRAIRKVAGKRLRYKETKKKAGD